MPSSPRPIRTAAAALIAVCLAGPLLAHDVTPASLQLRPGTTGFIYVADQGTCPATITAKSGNGAIVKVYALDMVKCDGSLLPGGGNSATVPDRVDQIFAVVADATITTPQSTAVEICWVGKDFGKAGPCQENNCNPYAPHPVTVLVSPNADSSANKPFDGFAGDPVATDNGELYLTGAPDLARRGRLPIEFQRHYSSRFIADGLPASRLGAGWRHNYDWTATTVQDAIEITAADGRQFRFEQGPFDPGWTLASGGDGVPFALIDGAAGSHVLCDPLERQMRTFDSNGRMTLIDDGRGNTLALGYVAGRLATVSDGLGRQLAFTYDGSARLTQVSDGTRAVGFGYDGMSRLVSFTDANGGVTAYAYSATLPSRALLATLTRPEGNVPWTQVYDANGRVVTQSDADGNQRTFFYDLALGETTITEPLLATQIHTHVDGALTKLEFENGLDATMTYDTEGRRTRVTDRVGDRASIAWDDDSGFPASATGPDGSVTRFHYAHRSDGGFEWHDLASVTRPDGTLESFTWDGDGNVLTRTDGAGRLWQRTYGANGELLTATAPDGGVRAFGWRPDFLLDHVVDPAGRTTSFDYDALGRLIEVALPGGATRAAAWDDLDRLVSVTDEAGKTTQLAWDDNSNLTGLLLPGGRIWSFGYDGMDRLDSVLDPEGGAATFQFDERGRPTLAVDGDGVALGFDWSATGRIAGVTDGEGRLIVFGQDGEDVLSSASDAFGTTTLASDARGLVTQSTSPEGRTFKVARDEWGQPIALTDGEGGKTTIGRDDEGRIVAIESKMAGAAVAIDRDAVGRVAGIGAGGGGLGWSIGRDSAGEVTSAIDPIGRELLATLDVRGRPGLLEFPNGFGDVQLGWTARGELASADFSDGTLLQWQHDDDGRVVSATDVAISRDDLGRVEVSNGINSVWGPGGRLQSTQLSAGLTVTYDYDLSGKLVGVDDGVGGSVQITWDAAGRLDTRTFANAAIENYDWSDDGFLTRFLLGVSGTTLIDLQFKRDGAGRIVEADRLQPVIGTPTLGATERTFDAAGQDASFTFDPLGRRTGDGTRTWTYDFAGRVTDAFDGVDTYHYTWDAMGQVVSGQLNSDPVVDYLWNYATTQPSLGVLKEGGVDKTYFVSTPEGVPLWRISAMSGAHRYYHFDEQGNTLAESDGAGAITQSYAWGTNGELLASLQPVGGYPYALLTVGARDFSVSLGAGIAIGDRFWDVTSGQTLQPDRRLSWLGLPGHSPYGTDQFPQPASASGMAWRSSVVEQQWSTFLGSYGGGESSYFSRGFRSRSELDARSPGAIGGTTNGDHHGAAFSGWNDCASCHPSGLTDNVTWSFGRGPRTRDATFVAPSVDRLPTAAGSTLVSGREGGQRVLNWTAIFDEIQDFEQNTRPQPTLDPAAAKAAFAKLLKWREYQEGVAAFNDAMANDEPPPEFLFLSAFFVGFPVAEAESRGEHPILKGESFGLKAIQEGSK